MSDKRRTLFCSDIHGTYIEFIELLKKVQYNKETDRLIILGDAINRGNDSISCIRYIRENDIEMLMGNHEQHLLRWWKGSQDPYWLATRPHYAQFTDDDIHFISGLPLYIKVAPNLYAIHAGVKPNLPIEQQRKEDLLYLRYTDEERKVIPLKKVFNGTSPSKPMFWTEFGPFMGNSIVYGHNVNMDTVRIDKFEDGTACYGIDSGCVFGGSLSVLIWETKEVVQVKAKEVYHKGGFD